MGYVRRPGRGGLFARALLAAVALAAAGPPALAAGEERVRWTVPMAFHSSYKGLGDTLPWLADRLDKASNGTIRLQVFEPGRLVAGNAVFEAVRSGRVEAGYSSMGYEDQKVPASVLFGARPFGMEPWEFVTWYFNAGGRALLEETFAAEPVVPILCGMVSPEAGGWFRTEIKSLDQFKGMKIRATGLAARTLEKLGVRVAAIPASGVQRELETGAIDGAEFSLPSVDEEIGLPKVANYAYFPGWHQPYKALYLYVARPQWSYLSAEQRNLIDTGCTAAVTYSLSRSESLQGDVIKRFKADGIKVARLPEPVLHELKRASEAVLAEETAKDPLFKRVLDSQKAFEATYGEWKQLGYLPRDWH